jgi:hypothetical protein
MVSAVLTGYFGRASPWGEFLNKGCERSLPKKRKWGGSVCVVSGDFWQVTWHARTLNLTIVKIKWSRGVLKFQDATHSRHTCDCWYRICKLGCYYICRSRSIPCFFTVVVPNRFRYDFRVRKQIFQLVLLLSRAGCVLSYTIAKAYRRSRSGVCHTGMSWDSVCSRPLLCWCTEIALHTDLLCHFTRNSDSIFIRFMK